MVQKKRGIGLRRKEKMSEKTAVRLPKPEEVEMIKMNARRAFEFEGVKFDDFKSGENGKLTITAAIPSAKRDAIVAALFGFGIVMIETGRGEWGFAVRA